jgi:DNA mismatch endonuclease (patch repair protein)
MDGNKEKYRKEQGTPSKYPTASSSSALKRMKAAKPTNTAPEVALRLILEELGLNFAVNSRPVLGLKREVDLLFEIEKVAVLVDGCFWHGCPIHGTWPKQNAEFWKTKIESNKRRDIDTNQRLEDAGWIVIRVWEHENPYDGVKRILEALNASINNSRMI